MKTVEWPVFICYRQEDGTDAARWLHRKLHGSEVEFGGNSCDARATIAVYLDAAAPAVADWQTFHGHELAGARALLVVCTPGSFANFGPEDWVHREIDWWLEHRNTAPILIDTTQQGERWVPESIHKRWPKAQLVKVNLHAWASLSDSERKDLSEIALGRIIEGIKASEQTVRLDDINKQVARAFVERAERAIVDHEELTANILLAHAYALDRDEDIRDHFLAQAHLQNDDTERAKPHIERLLRRQRDQARQYLAAPALIDRLVLLSTTRAALDSWLVRTARLGENAYDAVLSFKGIVGRTSLAEHRLWRRVGRQEPEVYMRLQRAQRRISMFCLDRASGDERTSLDGAVADLLLAKREVAACARLETTYARWLSTTHSDIQEYLHESDALLDFFRYANRYAVWIVTRTRNPIRIELGPAMPIDELVAQLQLTIGIEPTAPEYSAISRRLSSLVWAPMSDHLRESQLVYIIPDGSLVDIPFGALPDRSTSDCLLERYNLVYLSSAQELVPWPDQVPLSQRALIVGLSSFDEGVRHSGFLNLPAVDREIEAISRLWRDVTILRGQEATDAAVQREAQSAGIVHFATHGIEVPPVDSRQMLFRALDNPMAYIGKAAEASDPLQNTGLVLWNNVLTARDLSYFDFEGVDLVVLSMCAGKSARWSGEGSFGMARAFVEAGAASVVTATWAVDDLATSEFMTRFYRNLANGQSKAAALRAAALYQRCKQEFQHPSFWAQFSMYGRQGSS